MSGFNEDNFLEELMPLLRRRLTADPCPEAEALRAVAEGKASETLKNAIAMHTARCPACRDLQHRLQAFDDPMLTGMEAEWEQTEERLDGWLESFLTSEAAVYQVGHRTKEARPHLWWKRLVNPPIAWQMRWVLVPVAASAVVICSFLAGRLSAPRPRELTAAATPYTSSSPNPQPAGTVASDHILESRPAQGRHPSQATPRTQPNPAEGAAVASSAPRRISPSPVPPVAPQESARATDTAILTQPAPSNPGTAPISSPLEPPQNLTGASAPVTPISPSLRSRRAVETAGVSRTAPLAGRSGTGMPPGHPFSAVNMLLAAPRKVASAPEATAVHSPAIPAPQVIRLDAGTRVWITLQSVRQRADGVSEFQGVLLLPVTQSGAVLLGRNAEVSGTMTVRNGKTSVQILEFLSPGARYKLRSASGEADLRLLGAGEVVEFDAGRVLEAWMASVSVYEKLPGDSRPPE